MIRLILTRFRRHAMTCSEAGRAGYVTRHERERETIRAKAREMCGDMGIPVPESIA